MTFVSYAQNFEDVILWRALYDVGRGRYIDIGAHDPVVDSVSLAFYEAGWRGIHVEPTPSYAAKLREARPDETVIEAAVTDDPGPIEFYEIPETGLSTGKSEIADHHGESGYSKRKIFAPCIRLDKLLGMERGDVHWLKIDVEGMEADVLRSWGKSRKRPWILAIESTLPGTQEATQDQWIHEVLDRGYSEVFFDGLSRYFLHEKHSDLAARFDAPANVFDRFEIAEHHFSAATLREHSKALETRIVEEREQADRLNRELLATTQHNIAQHDEKQRSLRLQHEQELAELARQADAERQKASTVFADMQRELRDTYRAIGELQEKSALRVEQLMQAEREQLRALEVATQESALHHQKFVEAEKEHRRSIESLHAERQAAEESLRSELRNSQSEITSGKVEQARLHERLAAVEKLREDLGRQLDHHRFALHQADVLIRNAVAIRPGAWRQVGEALGLTKPSSALEALASWSLPMPVVPSQAGHHLSINSNSSGYRMPFDVTPSRNPYLRADFLAELLSWHDIDFVRCAYVTVLGRQPDPDGEAYYVNRIRRGVSKLHVLRQLRTAPEAASHDPGIAGFDRALKEYRLAQLPIIGWLFRGTVGAQIEGGVHNRLRSIENSLGVTLEACRQLADEHAELKGLVAATQSGVSTAIASQLDSPSRSTVKPALPLSPKAEEIFAAMARVR